MVVIWIGTKSNPADDPSRFPLLRLPEAIPDCALNHFASADPLYVGPDGKLYVSLQKFDVVLDGEGEVKSETCVDDQPWHVLGECVEPPELSESLHSVSATAIPRNWTSPNSQCWDFVELFAGSGSLSKEALG